MPEAEKDLRALDKSVKVQIVKKIGHLESNPGLGTPLSNVLKGRWRLHIGKYRVLYEIVKQDIFVVRIKHRKDAYEQ